MTATAEMETRTVCQVPTGEPRFIETVPCLKFGLQEEMAHFVKYLNIYSLICLALFSRKKRTNCYSDSYVQKAVSEIFIWK
jgi:hypothetical protein